MSWVNDLPLYMLVFTRIAAFLMTAPVFSAKDIPAQYKIGLSFALALFTGSTISQGNPIPLDGTYVVLILKEILVGVTLGFTAAMMFFAVQIAGSLIDIQAGFSIASIFDPQTGTQLPLTGRWKYMLAVLFMLSLNGHHLLLAGILSSYRWIGAAQWIPSIGDGHVSTYLVLVFGEMFKLAFMMALPVVGSLFLVDAALGIVARTVPQMNVFTVGLPIKIMAHFLIYIVILPGFFYLLQKLFQDMVESMNMIMRILGASS